MAYFVSPDYPAQHQGVARAASFIHSVQDLRARLRGGKGLAALLLAGAVSALVLVADKIVSTWTDGHLFMAWVALWAVVFAALALFSDTAQTWSSRMTLAWKRRSEEAEERLANERVWAAAQSDPRFMADLQAARMRAEREALAAAEPAPHWPFANAARKQTVNLMLY